MKSVIKFLSELGMLNRVKRSGYLLAGLDGQYLGLHIVRAAQIAYVLAHIEGANPEKAACIILFHDNGELRVGDQNKIGARYFQKDKAERNAIEEQLSQLPEVLALQLMRNYDHLEKRDTKDAIIAKDADWLESALYAKEKVEQGYPGMQNWINNIRVALETKTAKQWLEEIEAMEDFTNCWWQGLKKMTYAKMK